MTSASIITRIKTVTYRRLTNSARRKEMKASKLLTVLRCAEADLIGAKQARDQMDVEVHDWRAHQLSIDEVQGAIESLSSGNQGGDDVATFALRDQLQAGQPPIMAQIETKELSGQIWMRFKGYGEYNSRDGEGYPVLVEQADGVLRVVVWSDINQEDATHIVSLDDAREVLRCE